MDKENSVVKIPIVAGYAYSIDRCNNHILYYTTIREKKELGRNGKGTGVMKEHTEILGYYSSMEMMLKAVIKDSAFRKIENGDIKTVKEHLDSLKEMEERIKTITGGF